MIIHAGDMGGWDIPHGLETIIPVKAVRDNNDRDEWANHIPQDFVIEYDSHLFHVLHELDHLSPEPDTENFSSVIYGHSTVLCPKQKMSPSISRQGVPSRVDCRYPFASPRCTSLNLV